MKFKALPLVLTLPLFLVSCGKNDNSDVVENGKTNFEIGLDDSYNAVITGYNGNKSSISIPKKYIYNGKEYPVIKIADNAFNGCSFLSSVKIPSTIMSIGKNAFYGTKIYNDQKDNSNIYVDGWLILGNEIGDTKIRGIASNALENFSGDLVLNKEDVTLDDEYDFFSISDNAFYGSNITSFESDIDFNYIGKSCFKNSKIKSAIFNGTVPYFSDYLFTSSELETVKIPSTVWLLGVDAFRGTKIKEITLDENITHLQSGVFQDCSLLSKVLFKGSNVSFSASTFKNDSLLEDIKLPSNLTSIPSEMFYNCRYLSNIDIPSTVSYIGGQAFYGCSLLKEVVLPDSVSKLTYQTFGECKILKSVVLPKNITLENKVFYGALALEKIYYKGSQSDLEAQTITYDAYFNTDVIYYYQEDLDNIDPTLKYWHYNSENEIEEI